MKMKHFSYPLRDQVPHLSFSDFLVLFYFSVRRGN